MIDILFAIIVLSGSAGLKGAYVHCEGFANFNTDRGPTDEPMITDSRGVTWSLTDGPITTQCVAWKPGYTREEFWIAVTEKDTRFAVSLAKES